MRCLAVRSHRRARRVAQDDGPAARRSSMRPSAGELIVSAVVRSASAASSHHYGKGDGGLDHLSLTIAAGEKVGLVGRSGAGKSTLVNLILRFFEAESGMIEIDGQDIRRVDPGQPAPPHQHGDAGRRAAAPLGARQHRLRPEPMSARKRSRRRRGRHPRTTSSRRCATRPGAPATMLMSASAA